MPDFNVAVGETITINVTGVAAAAAAGNNNADKIPIFIDIKVIFYT